MNDISTLFQKYKIYVHFLSFLVVLGFVYLTCYELYLAQIDTSNNAINYILLIVLPLLLVICFLVHLLFDSNMEIQFYYFAGMLTVFFLFLYGFIYYLPSIDYDTIFKYIFMFIGIVLALSLVFWIFIGKLNDSNTWDGFFVNMIFYIPCMIISAFQYLTKDFLNTSSQITLLFGIEIVVLLLYFYGLPALEHSIYSDGILLLNHPLFLNKKENIGGILTAGKYSKLTAPQYSPYDGFPGYLFGFPRGPSNYRTNYAISMWVFMNTMPNTRMAYIEETDVFYYGTESNSDSSFHPKLTYVNDGGVTKYKLYYSGNTSTHEIELPGQKWNNLVFNYRDDGVDLFVNGVLTLSHTFASLPQYTDTDVVCVGDSKTGSSSKDIFNTASLYGSICSVAYYTRPLSLGEIVRNYNVLSVRNPPILER